MHDIKWIREERDNFIEALSRRGNRAPEAIEAAKAIEANLRGLDSRRRELLTNLENKLARRNAASKEIGQAKAQNDEEKAECLMREVANLKADIPGLEAEVKEVEKSLDRELAAIPNVPLADVPEGADEKANIERLDHRFGVQKTAQTMGFTPKQHFEVGEGLGQMDFETAAKLSGARFVVNKGPLARLERALGQFFLDVHTGEHGYMEVNPPLMVRDDAMFGTAQLPKFRDDQFYVNTVDGISNIASEVVQLRPFSDEYKSKLSEAMSYEGRWLIPTAEVPLTNLVRESILSEEQLPMRLTACTPCFRAEAGAAGRDTRGMIRQHQFTKVELVSITTPEKSAEEHERMLACAEAVLKKLDLAYRVVTLCTGDMGFASQKTYDIEVWLPGQNAYREISSCSVCGDFQARRMNARYRPAEGKGPRYVHTLNGSGVAVGRALVAVLETYQQENGSVAVPEALLPYMGGLKTIEKLK